MNNIAASEALAFVAARRLGYERVLGEARRRHDARSLSQLVTLGPPPYHHFDQMLAERQCANTYESRGATGTALIVALLTALEYSLYDDYSWLSGLLEDTRYFFGPTMDGPFTRVDFFAHGIDFQIPVFVIQGADDDIEPAALAKSYVEAIRAPQKQFIEIPGAGHTVSMTFGDYFLKQLIELVRPLATARQELGTLPYTLLRRPLMLVDLKSLPDSFASSLVTAMMNGAWFALFGVIIWHRPRVSI